MSSFQEMFDVVVLFCGMSTSHNNGKAPYPRFAGAQRHSLRVVYPSY